MSDLSLSAGPTRLIPPEVRPEFGRKPRPSHAATAQGQVEAGRAQQGPARNDRAWRSAVEFEAVFLSQMLEQMFTDTQVDAPFGGGPTEETWNSLMNQEYGRAIAGAGGVGIAKHVYSQMLRLQEV